MSTTKLPWRNAEFIKNNTQANNLWAERHSENPHGNLNQALSGRIMLVTDDITKDLPELTAKLEPAQKLHGHKQNPVFFLIYTSASSASLSMFNSRLSSNFAENGMALPPEGTVPLTAWSLAVAFRSNHVPTYQLG